ncbi:hypothetical protein V5O48_007736 [Marasmius crinis-equi]|uniref:Uncharacterized protein n=1 Tax=Marasmius crinis-equi TaxID=585013 RepID=A0ABR3FGA9_9AGAR
MSAEHLDVIELTDTESENESLPPSSQWEHPPTSSQPASDVEVLEISSEEEDSDEQYNLAARSSYSSAGFDSDDDLPELSVAFAQIPANGSGGSRKRDRADSVGSSLDFSLDSSPPKRSRATSSLSYNGSNSDRDADLEEPATSQSAGPSKPQGRARLTEEEKVRRDQAKKDEKQRKQREKEEKKAAAEREKEEKKARKQQEREEKEATKAQDKEANELFKKANTLKNDKNAVLPEMEIILSDTLLDKHHELIQQLKSKLTEKKTKFGGQKREKSLFGRYKTIRWRKHHTAKWNPKELQWDPCEPYDADERTALLWLDAEDLVKDLDNLKAVVQDFRERLGLTARDTQTFILFYGIEKHPRLNHDKVEYALAGLEMTMHTHHIFCHDPYEAATRLYDLSADIVGKGPADTWKKMLAEIHRVTTEHAKGIRAVYSNYDSLMETYGKAEGEGRRGEDLLVNCRKERRVDGQLAKNDKVGNAISKRVHTVLFGDDPLELVDKEYK